MSPKKAAPRILDATLRDGSHAIGHRFTPEQVAAIAGGLDAAGIDAVGVGHGDGLGGSSRHFGVALYEDSELHRTARDAMRRAVLTVTLVPGIGTKEDLREAHEQGAGRVRIATHCTEADIAIQHIELARELGMEVHGDLMMPHMREAAELVEQARIMADAGAEAVFVMDSAGALLPDGMRERVAAFRSGLPSEVEVGVHAHENLAMGVANTIAAIAEGATLADGCLGGLGAGAGNCRTEVLVAVLDRLGYATGEDLWLLQDLVEEEVRPLMDPPPTIDSLTLTLGYAGVASSLLTPSQRAADRFGVQARDVIVELGNRHAVSGQEDLAIAIAADLAPVDRA